MMTLLEESSKVIEKQIQMIDKQTELLSIMTPLTQDCIDLAIELVEILTELEGWAKDTAKISDDTIIGMTMKSCAQAVWAVLESASAIETGNTFINIVDRFHQLSNLLEID